MTTMAELVQTLEPLSDNCDWRLDFCPANKRKGIKAFTAQNSHAVPGSASRSVSVWAL